jgi:hypothetical protein
MKPPTIICVLGMHRSGTSLLAQVLHALGLDLGPEGHLMRPSPANPQGHWENELIKELNDEILERLGGTWSAPPELPPKWEDQPELDDLRRRARALVAEEFGSAERWGFKDPRTCLTLPFWQRILPPMRYLICLRNPMDVAFSLARRELDPIEFEQGTQLWLTYVRAAIKGAAPHPHHMVFYEDLMVESEPVVREIADFIGSGDSQSAEAYTQAAIRVAVSDGLWHHRTPVPNVVAERRLPFGVKALYLALRLFAGEARGADVEALELLGAAALDATRHEAELTKALGERRGELEQIMQARAEEQRLRQQAETELQSTSGQLRRTQTYLLEAQRQIRRLESDAREREARERKAQGRGGGGAPRDPEYAQLVADVRERALSVLPEGATVLVAAKGDDALVALEDRTGLHFPVGEDGRYPGYHPAGDTAVIAQLEAMRADGADHLLLPEPTLWWLDYYRGLRRHLEDRYVELLRDERCAIYSLQPAESTSAVALLAGAVESLRIGSAASPSVLDWHSGLGLSGRLPELATFTATGNGASLPYLDGTVDVVVLASGDAARLAEARRVASGAVIVVDRDFPESASIEWQPGTPAGWGGDVCVALLVDAQQSGWRATLASLAETLGAGFAGELLVAGESAALERVGDGAAHPQLRRVEAAAGAGLAQLARIAAQESERSFLAFVAAPALPLPGWLPSTLSLLSRSTDAGVIGGRTVSPFGVLEEAGGVLAADGSRRRRGAGDQNPDRPEYCYVRRVDFCSPPLLAARRDVFERLGGFRNGDGACADPLVDLSLRAGQTGSGVYYQPQARLVRLGEPLR